MRRMTARRFSLLVVAFCALWITQTAAAADDIATLRAKAEKGDAEAQFDLGLRYVIGAGVPRNDREAVKWFQKAIALWITQTAAAADDIATLRAKAEKGDAEAQFGLGRKYRFGIGVPRNDGEAVKWYRKAAEQGLAKAQYNLANAYHLGRGVPKDVRKAVKWYRKAAEQGNAKAHYNLGVSYHSGHGVPIDLREAVKWYRKAAEQGLAESQCTLGRACHYGVWGVPKDNREAVKWFRKAAEQGHARAQNYLGQAYYLGQGVPKDAREGIKWYRKAAEQGFVGAHFNLGVAYHNGFGVPKDDREAVKWYRKAAEQGDAQAHFSLGRAYLNGEGVLKDHRESVKWYRKAAEQGDANAQYNLGVFYDRGEGVPKDLVAAYAWWNLAAAQDFEGAAKNRSSIEREMTAGQIAEAQRLSRQLAAQIEKGVRSKDQRPGSAPAPVRQLGQVASTGTGFFVTEDGYFVTNAHVVEGASRVQVMTKKGTLAARVVHRDKESDLALLKVSGSFEALPVVSSRRLREGTKVFTFGYPNPDIQGFDAVYTSGDISKLTGIRDDRRTLQISVPIQPGNSGGPLVNKYGNVVGVVVARLNALKMLREKGTLPQNVNYAVKSTRLLLLLEEHIPDAGKKLKDSFSRKARKPEAVRDEVKQATVLILVERGR
jgi:TPR repeat protein